MKPMRLWLCVVFVFVGRALSATTLVPADFTQMARESELIVRGTVVNVQGQTAGPRRAIESVITVYVTDTLKGTTGTTAVFRVPGGRVGAYRRVMVGAPVFAAGDDVILFLKGRAPAIAMPYGLSQGVYRVARQGGGAVVTPAVAAASGRVVRGDPSRRPLDPAAFAREVQRALGNVVAPSLDSARDGPERVEGPNNRRAIPRAR